MSLKTHEYLNYVYKYIKDIISFLNFILSFKINILIHFLKIMKVLKIHSSIIYMHTFIVNKSSF